MHANTHSFKQISFCLLSGTLSIQREFTVDQYSLSILFPGAQSPSLEWHLLLLCLYRFPSVWGSFATAVQVSSPPANSATTLVTQPCPDIPPNLHAQANVTAVHMAEAQTKERAAEMCWLHGKVDFSVSVPPDLVWKTFETIGFLDTSLLTLSTIHPTLLIAQVAFRLHQLVMTSHDHSPPLRLTMYCALIDIAL